MTHNQRWLETVNRKNIDRLPTFYSATEEFTDSLKKTLGLELDSYLIKVE
jgi:hypothetical protein